MVAVNHPKAFFLYFFLPALVLAGVFIYGFGENLSKPEVLRLKSELKFLDFGPLEKSSGFFSRDLVLRNLSGEDLAVEKIYANCACLVVEFSVGGRSFNLSLPKDLNERPLNLFVPKDSDFSVKVILDTSDLKPGNFSGQIYFMPEFGKTLSVKVKASIY